MASDPRPFPWDSKRGHYDEKLHTELRNQITPTAPLKAIWEGVKIGSHFKPSSPYFFIDKEALPNIKRCLTDDQKLKLDRGIKVKVTAYDAHAKNWTLELLKQDDGHGRRYAFVGQWKNIMDKNRWNEGTNICFWGISNEGRNNEEVRFLLTSRI